MAYEVKYRSREGLWGRFVSHAELGLSQKVQPHKVNWVEKAGDKILWTVEEFPAIAWEKMKEPRIVTVALTSFSLLANSFLFYPRKAWMRLKAFFKWLPLPSLSQLRFGTYLFTCALILGYGMRAFGRFSNPELLRDFYEQRPPLRLLEEGDVSQEILQ